MSTAQTFASLQTAEGIKSVLDAPLGKTGDLDNRKIIYRMLQAMYARQTSDEQNSQTTSHVNKIGFNKFDADFLSDVAIKTKNGEPFTDGRVTAVAKSLQKYIGQLVSIATQNNSKENATVQNEKPVVDAAAATIDQPKVKQPKEKKPHIIKRRKISTVHKKYQVHENDRLIAVSGDDYYFMISFPEVDAAKYETALKAIPECQYWHRNVLKEAVQAEGTAISEPEFKVIWRVRKTEETLKLVAAFGKQFKFDFAGDILMQAQLSTSEAKELETLSYAKSCSTLKLPKLPTWTKAEWQKYNFSGPYMKTLKPYPFQIAGANYALKTKKTFIADEMGLGKTIQALLTIKLSRRLPWLIFVPATIKINWYREAKKWLGKNVKVGIAGNHQLTPLIRSEHHKPYTEAEKKKLIRDGKKWLTEHQVVIVNYDRVQKYSDYLKLIKWEGVVFDESHYCKSNSMRTRACKELLGHLNPEYVLAMSGTPVLNGPKELVRQLQLLDRINEFGGPVHFLNRYCNIANVDMSKMPKLPKLAEDGTIIQNAENDQDIRDAMIRKMYQNQIELNKQLRSMCYVRRERDDAMPQLPEKTRTTILLDINNRKEYEKIERDVVAWLMERVARDEKFLAKIAKLSKEEKVRQIKERQASVGYKSARAEALVKLEMLKQCAAIGKMDAAQEWLENAVEDGAAPVVFATHNNILDELEARFPKFTVSLRGGMSEAARQEAIDTFVKDPKVRMFFGSLKAAGVGVDGLQRKSHTPVFVELGWTPAVHDQAEDRTLRIGQKNAVDAYYLIAQNTVEERIARIIERKRNVVDATAFGDPLAKSKLAGTILGDIEPAAAQLIAELTAGKNTAARQSKKK
jgi:SNF2-related domain